MSATLTDFFCGAGGSSDGARRVPGLIVDQAANHWPLAILIHNTNHPTTDHAVVDLHQERPSYFRPTDFAWFSPECTKWTVASGDAAADLDEGLWEDPLADEAKRRSRMLMFDVIRFVEYHRYRAGIVENVVDVATRPKYRHAFNLWLNALHNLGYSTRVISLNSMHAQAHGLPAPQSRDRLYVAFWRAGDTPPDFDSVLRPMALCGHCDRLVESRQAWKNGRTIGRYRDQYTYVCTTPGCGRMVEPGYLPASTAIDWTLKGQRIGDRIKPLAPKTRARIAAGIARYWRHLAPAELAEQANQLLVPVEGRDGKQPSLAGAPLRTQTTRAETALVRPFIAELRGGGSDARSVAEALATITAGGNHHALVTPAGGTWNDRAKTSDDPLPTLTTREAYALVTPYYGASMSAQSVDQPLGTLTTVDRYALITRHFTARGDAGQMSYPVTEYMRTLTTTAQQSLLTTPGPVTDAEIDDCFLRMLQPMEAAAGMAFPSEYRWDVRDHQGKLPSKRNVVKMAGNSVTPPASRDLLHPIVAAYGGTA